MRRPIRIQNQPRPVDAGLARCKAVLHTLVGSRELLLEAVLDGPYNFRLKCQRLTRGTAVSDDMIAMMWGYILHRQGPCPRYEYEMLVMKREAAEDATRKETAFLHELGELAHGKNAEEESAKIARASASPELTRLPEIAKV